MKNVEITNLMMFGIAWFQFLNGFRSDEYVSMPLLLIALATYVPVLIAHFARAKADSLRQERGAT